MWYKVMKGKRNLLMHAACLALSFLMIFGTFVVYCDPTPTPTQTQSESNPPAVLDVANSAIFYNMESDTVMYTKNADKRVAPATTAKMMTALIALDMLEGRMEEEVTIPSVVMQNALGTHMELQTGEVIKIKELIHGLIMANANDAAYMLALVCSGSIEEFVAEMNNTAKTYGMDNTNYVNVTGIDDQAAYTTARDVLTLSIAAFNTDEYKEIAKKPTYTVEATNKKKARELHTRNYMLSKLIYPNYYYKNANGLCAGSTENGGYCISATAEIGNMNFVSVVMGAPGSYSEGFYNFICARALFDWGPDSYSYRTVMTEGEIVGELKVSLAEEYDYVAIVPSESVGKYIPKSLDLSKAVEYRIKLDSEELVAPVEDKQKVGEIIVYLNGLEVGKSELVTLRGLTLSRKENTIKNILDFVSNKTVITVVLVASSAAILGVLIYARYLYVKKRKIKVKAHTEDE